VVWTARNVILRDENAVRAFFSHPILIVCWLYLLSTLPSFVNARDFTSAFLFLTTKLLAYVVLASIIADMVRTRDRLASLCKTVLSISLIVVGIFGSYELASGNSILSFFGLDYHLISGSSEGILATTKTDVLSVDREAEWFRVASTYLDPDLFCVFVILSLGYAMGLWHLTVSGFWRAIIVIYFPLAHAMLIATGSRSGFLAIFAFWIMVLFMFRVRFRIALITFSCAGILCLIPFLHELFPAYRSGISMDAFHSDARYGFWKTGINMIRDKPLIGIGLANFTAEYFDYSSPSAIKGKAYMAHNIFLQVLSETGLIGLVFFLALIFSVLTTLWRMIRDSKDAEIVNLSKCLFVSGVSCVPLALTHNVLDLAYLWITLGVIVAVCNLDSGASADSKHNEMSGVLC
ncbi:MAG: O-antigen ligase family protein, partial [Thermodesulfobacteriota bacterium]|nr:O-antigen ligase family protein [Thermodesulfobacteriota bacterium]